MELPTIGLSENEKNIDNDNNNNNNKNVEVDKSASNLTKISSEKAASAGFIFGILFAIIIVIAGKIHWGDEAPICLVPADIPFQDYTNEQINDTDYPNPRCASLYKNGGRFPEDQGPTHYFWQLPPETRDLTASQSTAWIFYAFHQTTVWATIYYAQNMYGNNFANIDDKIRPSKYSNDLRKVNIIALLINLFCWFLHLLHTHVWYDALAPSVHEMSSQGSVILMLVIVLIIEAPNRGLFLGETRTFRPNAEVLQIVKKYHGYVFSWAVIYTCKCCFSILVITTKLLNRKTTLLLTPSILHTHTRLYIQFGITRWKVTSDICLDSFMFGLSCYRVL
jgi:hypothetical protein